MLWAPAASARKLKGVIDVPNNDGLCKRNPTASAPSAPCTIRPNDTTPPTGLDIFEIGCVWRDGEGMRPRGKRAVSLTPLCLWVWAQHHYGDRGH